jgi:hypothetical protein
MEKSVYLHQNREGFLVGEVAGKKLKVDWRDQKQARVCTDVPWFVRVLKSTGNLDIVQLVEPDLTVINNLYPMAAKAMRIGYLDGPAARFNPWFDEVRRGSAVFAEKVERVLQANRQAFDGWKWDMDSRFYDGVKCAFAELAERRQSV